VTDTKRKDAARVGKMRNAHANFR